MRISGKTRRHVESNENDGDISVIIIYAVVLQKTWRNLFILKMTWRCSVIPLFPLSTSTSEMNSSKITKANDSNSDHENLLFYQNLSEQISINVMIFYLIFGNFGNMIKLIFFPSKIIEVMSMCH